jgi:AraC-like DNA-binding protein
VSASYREILPASRLGAYVECYWSREQVTDAERHPVLPDGCADIVFTRQNAEPQSLVLAGLMTRPFQPDIQVGQSFFGVRFRPGMAACFFREAPLLKDAAEPLENLADGQARLLFDQLAHASSPQQMAALMDRSLRPADPPLLANPNLSPRQLRRVFLARAGVSPKFLNRILRFRQAADRIAAAAGRNAQPSWAQFAAGFGYYDQAHLIRDFHEFAGCTPAQFYRSRITSRA